MRRELQLLTWEPSFAVDDVGPPSGDVFADPLRLGYQVGQTHYEQTVVGSAYGTQVTLMVDPVETHEFDPLWSWSAINFRVEVKGLEPSTYGLQSRRSSS